MKGKGILIDDTYELKIVPVLDADGMLISGLQVGNTLYQNQALILVFTPGSVKSAPAVGVGLSGCLLSNDFLEWRRKIRQQLELDGQKVKGIKFTSSTNLSIDAEYNS